MLSEVIEVGKIEIGSQIMLSEVILIFSLTKY